MGALATMSHGITKMDFDFAAGPLGVMVDTGIGYGAGFALGELYHRYPDKWYGKHAPKIFALVGKLTALITSLITGGGSHIIGAIGNSIGQVGTVALGIEHGLRHARNSTGVMIVAKPKGSKLLAGEREVTSIGADRSMSFDAIEQMAAGVV